MLPISPKVLRGFFKKNVVTHSDLFQPKNLLPSPNTLWLITSLHLNKMSKHLTFIRDFLIRKTFGKKQNFDNLKKKTCPIFIHFNLLCLVSQKHFDIKNELNIFDCIN